MPNDLLLLTATLTPPSGVRNLARIDPRDRLRDYADALRFYIDRLDAGVFRGIVFVDNSDTDLSVLQAIARLAHSPEKIEFIRYYGLDYPLAYGRGYGEMCLVDHAMRHSKQLSEVRGDSVIWKTTGRYIVRNVAQLVAEAGRSPAHFHCHCRNYPTRWADMYFMGWTMEGYQAILAGSAEHLREDADGRSAERKLREIVDSRVRSLPVRRRFSAAPRLAGVRGWDNRRYEGQRTKDALRAVFAWTAPWIWI